jgi:carbon-monoxide dehydrogenase large subunit
VVIANSEIAAQDALELIEVDYEPLPSILHPRDSVRPGAVQIHEELGRYQHIPQVNPEADKNTAHHYWLRRGDVDEAFQRSELVVEDEYWVPWIAHVQLEPHGAIAQWSGDTFTIWSSSQAPFIIRETVAELYHLAVSKVRVIIPYVGGGFGGKSDVTIEPLIAVAAHKVPGLYVELILTREEMFYGSVIGRGAWGRIKTGVDREGNLLAQEAEIYFGSGGYADYSVWIAQGGGHNATGPYAVPNVHIDSSAVYTNTPPTGAYRGYGHPEVHWMVERQMDRIARQMEIDPYELRRKNLLMPGKENAIGQMMQGYNGRPDLCLQAVEDALKEEHPASGPRKVRGRGFACFMKSPVMRTNAQSGAIIRFNEDGTISVFTGAIEMGQGTGTVLSQIAAETLKVPFEDVHYAPVVDTEFSPYEWQTVASHTTWAVGNAVRLAALDALDQIKKAAADVFCIPVDQIDAGDGRVYPIGKPEMSMPFSAFGVGYTRADGSSVNNPVIGRGTFVPERLTYPNPKTGRGNMAASWTFGCQGAEVEVDLDTGRIEVVRLISAQDAGTVINPAAARGQIEGAMIQALGAALMEKLHFGDDGRILNSSFVDYRILTTADIPEMEVVFIETKDATGPYGARGLGEHGIVAIPPAIANAVADALGYEFNEIPITPEMVAGRLYPENE